MSGIECDDCAVRGGMHPAPFLARCQRRTRLLQQEGHIMSAGSIYEKNAKYVDVETKAEPKAEDQG